MDIVRNPPKAQWPELLRRPVFENHDLDSVIQPIVQDVKQQGDRALKEYTQRFDKVVCDSLQVSRAELEAAEKQIDPSLKDSIDTAKSNIEKFHRCQLKEQDKIETMPGVLCWRRAVAIERVGLYIPGGTAPLFSTLLMLGVPAVVAGCSKIVVCSPPMPDGTLHPAISYCAKLLGLQQVFKVGGAQAIAALAYGTESVSAVDKIFGPGNQYVTAAKQHVSREGVAIDLPAGPSEVAVVADSSANPAFIAADLLSQAEHGIDSQVVLVTTDEKIADFVLAEIEIQLVKLSRKDIATQALKYGKIVVLEDLIQAISLINQYAPEHLILAVEDPNEIAEKVVNAGSVFLGEFTCEAVGDYASGTNHTLPTCGYARSYSGVSLDSFMKQITFQQVTEQGLRALGPVVESMAEAEGLTAHREAVSVRLRSVGNEKD